MRKTEGGERGVERQSGREKARDRERERERGRRTIMCYCFAMTLPFYV